jgi:hypothetical protein
MVVHRDSSGEVDQVTFVGHSLPQDWVMKEFFANMSACQEHVRKLQIELKKSPNWATPEELR